MVVDGFSGLGIRVGGLARVAAAVGLGIAAEALLYGAPVGWLYAVFAGGLIGAALLFAKDALRMWPALLMAAMGVIALAVEPHWGALLLAFIGAISVALIAQADLVRDAWHWMRSVGKFALALPMAVLLSLVGGSKSIAMPNISVGAVSLVRQWAIPLLLASVFLLLFVIGNPLMADGMASFGRFFLSGEHFDMFDGIASVLRAAVIALLCWPFLRAPDMGIAESRPLPAQTVFRTDMVIRTLVLCNLLFGMQNLLDVVYLWGEGTLPATMTYAEYAHQGIYPLALAAMLVGALVLFAMPAGGEAERTPAARWLVFLWLVQTGVLTLSCLKRLDLYVTVYSLTYMRVIAVIATGIIGVGLVWIFLRVALQRSNGWLVTACTLTGAVMLFAGSVVDVGARIAWYNVTHSKDVGGKGVALDIGYLSRAIGPSAIPALAWYEDNRLGDMSTVRWHRVGENAGMVRNSLTAQFNATMDDWRAWTVRRHWLAEQVATLPDSSVPPLP